MTFLKSWTTIFIITMLLPLAGFGYSSISPVKEIAGEAYTPVLKSTLFVCWRIQQDVNLRYHQPGQSGTA